MPVEVELRKPHVEAFDQDALRVLNFLFQATDGSLAKEVGRRHLLRVADDNDLLATRHHADCVADLDLRSLVEHDEVERLHHLHVEELRDRKRTHQEARLVFGYKVAVVREELADRRLAPLLVHLALESAELAVLLLREMPAVEVGITRRDLGEDGLLGQV